MPSHTGLLRFVQGHLRPDSTIAVVGEGAAAVAEQLALMGGPPLAIEADRFALLSDDLNPPSVGRLREVPDSTLDLVILRRAWNVPVDVAAAMSVAHRAVRPGGEVIAADIDVNRLLDGPNTRYPVRLLYLAEPTAADRLRSSTASPALLASSAVRTGFGAVDMYTYDDVRGVYEDAAGLWNGIRNRGWRGAAWVSSERTGTLFEEVAGPLAGAIPAGEAVDREPWYAVIGRVD